MENTELNVKNIEARHELFELLRGVEPGQYRVTGLMPGMAGKMQEYIYDYSEAYLAGEGVRDMAGSPDKRPYTYSPSARVLHVSEHDRGRLTAFYEKPVKERALEIIEGAASGEVRVPYEETLLNALRNYGYRSEQAVIVKAESDTIIVQPRREQRTIKNKAFEIFAGVAGEGKPEVMEVDPNRVAYIRALASRYNKISGEAISVSDKGAGELVISTRDLIGSALDVKCPRAAKAVKEPTVSRADYSAVKGEFQAVLNELKRKIK